jgi:hypothetical protein
MVRVPDSRWSEAERDGGDAWIDGEDNGQRQHAEDERDRRGAQ